MSDTKTPSGNPDIAHVFYLRGMMEKIGRGSLLILNACRDRGLPEPVWSSGGLGVTLTFHAARATGEDAGHVAGQDTGHVTGEVAGEVTGEVMRLLLTLREGSKARTAAQTSLALRGQANFRDRYLGPALADGLVEMTLPDKPRSSRQAYRLTAKGRQLLATSEADAKDGG